MGTYPLYWYPIIMDSRHKNKHYNKNVCSVIWFGIIKYRMSAINHQACCTLRKTCNLQKWKTFVSTPTINRVQNKALKASKYIINDNICKRLLLIDSEISEQTFYIAFYF